MSKKDPTETGQNQSPEIDEGTTDHTEEKPQEMDDTSVEVEFVDSGSDEGDDSEPEVDEIDVLRKELDDYKDRWMRVSADLQNTRKRTLREIRDMQVRAGERILQQLLEPVDNLDRALKAAADSDSDENGDAFIKGIEMVQGQLLTLLDRESVKPMDSIGQPFDPMKHEAMMMLEREDVAEGTIVEEFQRGYTLGERVLRHARVIVSKAPSEAQTETTDENDKHTDEQ